MFKSLYFFKKVLYNKGLSSAILLVESVGVYFTYKQINKKQEIKAVKEVVKRKPKKLWEKLINNDKFIILGGLALVGLTSFVIYKVRRPRRR